MRKQIDNWYNQYLCNSKEHAIANKLWIYYYTQTEKYDRNLNQIRPSQYEEGMVVPYGDSRKWSEQNACKVYNFIYDVANHYGVNSDQMNCEKKCVGYMKQVYIEREYKVIEEQSGFKFIYDYIEYLNSIRMEN